MHYRDIHRDGMEHSKLTSFIDRRDTILYQAAILNTSPPGRHKLATQFVRYLQSPRGQAILERAGFIALRSSDEASLFSGRRFFQTPGCLPSVGTSLRQEPVEELEAISQFHGDPVHNALSVWWAGNQFVTTDELL